MKLSKAIEIKELFYKGGEMPSSSDYREADRLSIEALKWISTHNDGHLHRCNSPLPRETEE